MNLKALGEETHHILRAGEYGVEGQVVSIRDVLDDAIAGTKLYAHANVSCAFEPRTPVIEVTRESTLAAARRLVDENPVALNFASAKNPGGGWLGGAKAQEESIARASGLVPTLESQPGYYAANRAQRSCLYTDHLIYSPGVPIIRDDRGELMPEPYRCAFITSPAPNQGAIEKNTPHEREEIMPTLERRGRQVLRVAAAHGHPTVILGAWGCGAFRCNVEGVADVFARLCAEPWPFTRIVFAIIGGRPELRTFETFRDHLVWQTPAPTES